MIVSGLAGLFYKILLWALSGMEFVGLPFALINALQTILVYGVWIVGADILALFISTVVGWWTIKFTVGVVLWVW